MGIRWGACSSQYKIHFISRDYRRSNSWILFAHWALRSKPSTGRLSLRPPLRCYWRGVFWQGGLSLCHNSRARARIERQRNSAATKKYKNAAPIRPYPLMSVIYFTVVNSSSRFRDRPVSSVATSMGAFCSYNPW